MSQIEVPGHGLIEFPDTMTDDEIVSAIKSLGAPQSSSGSAFGSGGAITPAAPAPDISSRATRELPELFTSGILKGKNPAKVAQFTTLAAVTPNEQELGKILNSIFPEIGVQEDEKGNVLIADNSTGARAIINKPGPSATDLAQMTGMATAFNPASKVGAGAVGGVKQLVKSGLASGGTQSIIEGAQALSGGEFNPEDVALASVVQPALQAGGRTIDEFNQNALKSLAVKKAQNSVRDSTLKAGQQAGFAVPPTMANPSVLNRVLEGIPGKAGVAQGASLKNQEVTNKLAKQALGLSDDTPLTEQSLQALRAEAGKAYEAIKNAPGKLATDAQFFDDVTKLSSDFSSAAKEFPKLVQNNEIKALQKILTSKKEISPKGTIELVKKLRFDASQNLKSFDDPAKAALGKAQRGAADALDSLIERNLKEANLDRFLGPGKQGAAEAYKQARMLIAKSYDVEAALNESTGNVSAKVLAKAYEKGKPISGELETIARFSNAFPKATQNVEPLSGVLGSTPLDWGIGLATSVATQNPLLMATTAARPVARWGMLGPLQSTLASPQSYKLPLANKALGLLNNPLIQQGVQAGLLSQSY